jgi:ATP-dependent Clp protease adaptor protein ClpS
MAGECIREGGVNGHGGLLAVGGLSSPAWSRRSNARGSAVRAAGWGGNWRVIVRNDDHNTFDHVATTLARVIPGMTVDQGYAMADRIHSTGLAIVWTGRRSRQSSTGRSSPAPGSRWRRSSRRSAL